MRQSESALAYITGCDPQEPVWLAQWNERWQCYHFVGGHRDDDESFRACVARELDEELQLREPHDCSIAPQPQLRLEFDAESVSTRATTHYVMQVFEVRLTDVARTAISARAGNRWLTADEIEQRCTSDGRQVSDNMARVLGNLQQGLSNDHQ